MFKGFFSYQLEHHRTHPFLKNFELAQLLRFVSSDLELAWRGGVIGRSEALAGQSVAPGVVAPPGVMARAGGQARGWLARGAGRARRRRRTRRGALATRRVRV